MVSHNHIIMAEDAEDSADMVDGAHGEVAPARNVPQNSGKCYRCGRYRHLSKDCTVAIEKICNKCGMPDHFAIMCKSTSATGSGKTFQPRKSQVNCTSGQEPVHTDHKLSDDNYVFNISTPESCLTAVVVSINDCHVEVLLDSGSAHNIISEDTFDKINKSGLVLENPGKPLYPYGTTTPLPIIGRFSCEISTNTKSVDTTSDVIRGCHRSLLSKATSVSLGLMQIADDQARVHAISDTGDSELNHILNKYDNSFEGLGKLKDYQLKIHIDENVPPIAQNVRRVPFHVRHQVDEKLDELLNLDVIEPVEGPTPWVSPLVVVPKPNKGIRLCLDMRCTNEAVKRERHPIPTVDEIL